MRDEVQKLIAQCANKKEKLRFSFLKSKSNRITTAIAQYIHQTKAEAEAARLKVAAGLSPAERAEWDYKTKVGVAEALSKTKWPTVVMSGNSGQNTAMDVIALKQMTDLVDKMSK